MPVLIYPFGNSDLYLLVEGSWRSFSNLSQTPDLQKSLQQELNTPCECTHLPNLVETLSQQSPQRLVTQVRFPIVEAVIQKLAQTAHWPQRWQWIVVETRQSDPKFHQRDTEGMGKLVKQYLSALERSENASIRKDRNLPPQLLPEKGPFPLLYHKNPAAYDEVLAFLRQELRERIRRYGLQNEQFFAVLGPGTPAMGLGFVISLVELLPLPQIVLLQAHQDKARPTSSIVKRISLAPRLKQWPVRQTLRALLDRYDYDGVLQLLEDLQGKNLWPAQNLMIARTLCEYGKNRLNLDFQNAQRHLTAVEESIDSDTWRTLVNSLPMGIRPKAPETLWPLLYELLWNAQMTLQRGMYHDLLGRLFRFQELYLQILLATYDVVKLSENRALPGSAFGRLEPCLSTTRVNEFGVPDEQGKTLEFHDLKTLNRTVLLACFRCIGMQNLLFEGWEQTWNSLEMLSKLVQLRNRSLIAHGWEPLSAENLAGHLQVSPENLGPHLSTLLQGLLDWWESHHPGWKPETPPDKAFKILNDTILQQFSDES